MAQDSMALRSGSSLLAMSSRIVGLGTVPSACDAYNAGTSTGHSTNLESFLDEADDNTFFYYRLEAEVSDLNHRLRQTESRVEELTAEGAARDAEFDVSSCTQVTQIPALAIDPSQIALLVRCLADDE